MISAPYDPEVHDAKKRTTSWIGYKAHLTETCETNTPHLIRHVETAVAPSADGDVVGPRYEALQHRELLPRFT